MLIVLLIMRKVVKTFRKILLKPEDLEKCHYKLPLEKKCVWVCLYERVCVSVHLFSTS